MKNMYPWTELENRWLRDLKLFTLSLDLNVFSNFFSFQWYVFKTITWLFEYLFAFKKNNYNFDLIQLMNELLNVMHEFKHQSRLVSPTIKKRICHFIEYCFYVRYYTSTYLQSEYIKLVVKLRVSWKFIWNSL